MELEEEGKRKREQVWARLKPGNPDLNLGLPRGQQGTKDFNYHLFPPRVYRKKLKMQVKLRLESKSCLSHAAIKSIKLNSYNCN